MQTTVFWFWRYMVDQKDIFNEALSYWHSKKPEGAIPGYSALDPAEIPKLLPFLFLTNVHWDPVDFSYGLTGGQVRNIMAENRRGQKLSEIPGKGPGSQVWANLTQVAESGQAAEFTAPYAGGIANMETIRYLSLPWTKSDGRVDVISHLVWVPSDIVYAGDIDLQSSL